MQRLIRPIVNKRINSINIKTSTVFLQKNCLSIDVATATNSYLDAAELAKYHTHQSYSYSTTTSSFPLVLDTINDYVVKHARNQSSKLAFGFPHQGINLTFGELKQRVDTAAQNLLDLGFVKGDRIAFLIPNSIDFVVLFLAASQIGLISVAMNPAYQLKELEYMLKKTGSKGLVIYDTFKVLQHLAIMRKICPELDNCAPGELKSAQLPDLKHIFIINSPLVPTKQTYKGTWSFSKISESQSRNTKHEIPYVQMDDSCLILFTSGTTGKPKGALMSHSSILNSVYLSAAYIGNPEALSMVCNPIPLFHVYGIATGLLAPMVFGTANVFPFYFPETLAAMKAIQGYKCNSLRGVPTQFVDMLNHPDRSKFDLSSLKNLILGGSTVVPELVNSLKEQMKINDIIIGYGMTETSYCHSVATYEDAKKGFKYAYESCGRGLPSTESKIIDVQTGKLLPHDVEGELCVRGRHVFKGYWDEPEKTKETIDKDGWLHTGDIFSMDSKGYLYFKSRAKDIIIRGGANIYPAEIESYLCTHPSIQDAQCFGVPDKRLQEEVCAWIKLKPNCKLTEDELKGFCKNNISHFKIPRYIKFVEAFPINANNKILKTVMREKATEELNLKA